MATRCTELLTILVFSHYGNWYSQFALYHNTVESFLAILAFGSLLRLEYLALFASIYHLDFPIHIVSRDMVGHDP